MMAAQNLPPQTNAHAAHIPVMLGEVLEALSPANGKTYIDGTFGRGGHTRAILEAASCSVHGIDRDPQAAAAAEGFGKDFGDRFVFHRGDFASVFENLALTHPSEFDGIFLDLGVSSPQLDQAERGFSFRSDGPLDMRMGDHGPTAADLVNTLPVEELARIFRDYGEERHAMRIARAIEARRDDAPFTRTGELSEVIRQHMPGRHKMNIDPATRCFQGLRIAVNNELGQIERALPAALKLLKPEGRLAVLSFHSLEDRIVKQFIQSHSGIQAVSRHLPMPTDTKSAALRPLKVPKKPSDTEIKQNPRARSVRLRAAVRIAHGEVR